MRLVSVHVYPVKGLRGFDADGATVEPWGLRGDRRHMLVDASGRFLSQREYPVLTQASAGYDPDGALRVRPTDATGLDELVVPPGRDGSRVDVTVWRDEVTATLGPGAAHAWFSTLVGAEVRLVYLDDPGSRPVDPHYGRADDRVSFADGYPLLVTTARSLDRLNEWLIGDGEESAPLPMNRFRPSIVVDGDEAFGEDDWHRIRVGDIEFRVVKPCGRCVVTTTDQDSGRRGRGPLRTLARRHRIGTALVFGQNLIPDGPGRVAVGDPVTVLA